MISKDLENNYLRNTWSNGIFTIPNDLYYSKLNNNIFQNENESDYIDYDEFISNSLSKKTTFTNLLTPNWKKHINNYVRHKFSGYRKKIRNFFKLYIEKFFQIYVKLILHVKIYSFIIFEFLVIN